MYALTRVKFGQIARRRKAKPFAAGSSGTAKGSKTFGYDSKTKRLFVPSSENGAMQVLVYESK